MGKAPQGSSPGRVQPDGLAARISRERDLRVFIDFSRLASPGYARLEGSLFESLKEAGKKLIVPLQSAKGLVEAARKKDRPDHGALVFAERSIAHRQAEKLVDIKGTDGSGSEADVLYYQFSRFRERYRLALITRDSALSRRMQELNGDGKGNPVAVYAINDGGRLLSSHHPAAGKTPAGNQAQAGQARAARTGDARRGRRPARAMFAARTEIAPYPDSLVRVSSLPQEGESVYAILQKKDIRLLRAVARGGEGVVFETEDPDVVCKVYRADHLSRYRVEKLSRMISCGFSCRGVCWPTDAICNRDGLAVGYLMPKARGTELRRCVFGPRKLFEDRFPGWTRNETVELAITILEKIRYLHENNIIIGDINPANILVSNPGEVYFVDTDSYQIEEFPCHVGTATFTAPEIQRKEFPTMMRTLGHERFAVATLLFMLMLPGKPPYAQQDGDDPITNIQKMDFSYPLGEKSNGKAPEGPWRFCWSHLPYALKEAFYETFRAGGKHSGEDTRLTATAWLSLFRSYRQLLRNGTMESQDSESLKVYPGRLKIVGEKASCRICGREESREWLDGNEGLCHDCLQLGYITQYCVECGNKFTITWWDKIFFKNKGWELPRRCPECRKRKNGL